jgi:hypothetical protein
MPRDIDMVLRNLKYVSMADFCNRIDQFKNIDDKLAYATEYLLNHQPGIDYALDEAIGVARMKLADAIAEYKEMKNKAVQEGKIRESFPANTQKDLKEYGNVENNERLNYFMSSPESYLKLLATKKLNDMEDEEMLLSFDISKQKQYESIINTIDNNDLYLDLEEKDRNYLHIGARLEAKFGGIDQLQAAANATKPTFFAKLFNKTSIQGKNLLTAYKGFSDPKNPLFGRKDTLERVADDYLTHIYPNWKHGDPLIDKNQIDRLSGTQKTRVILCNAILESIRKEDKMLDEYNKAVDNDDEKNFEFDDLFEDNKPKKTAIIDLDKDLDDSLVEENEIANESNPYVINNEIEM